MKTGFLMSFVVWGMMMASMSLVGMNGPKFDGKEQFFRCYWAKKWISTNNLRAANAKVTIFEYEEEVVRPVILYVVCREAERFLTEKNEEIINCLQFHKPRSKGDKLPSLKFFAPTKKVTKDELSESTEQCFLEDKDFFMKEELVNVGDATQFFRRTLTNMFSVSARKDLCGSCEMTRSIKKVPVKKKKVVIVYVEIKPFRWKFLAKWPGVAPRISAKLLTVLHRQLKEKYKFVKDEWMQMAFSGGDYTDIVTMASTPAVRYSFNLVPEYRKDPLSGQRFPCCCMYQVDLLPDPSPLSLEKSMVLKEEKMGGNKLFTLFAKKPFDVASVYDAMMTVKERRLFHNSEKEFDNL